MFSGGLSARRSPAVKVPVLAVRCIRCLPLGGGWTWRSHVGAAYRRLSVSNLPTRWTLVRKGDAPPLVRQHVSRDRRGRLGLTSAGCVADAIPPEWFPDTPGDFGAPRCGCGCEGTKTSRGRYSRNSPSCCCNSTMCRNVSFVKSVVPECSGMGGSSGGAPVFRRHRGEEWRRWEPVAGQGRSRSLVTGRPRAARAVPA